MKTHVNFNNAISTISSSNPTDDPFTSLTAGAEENPKPAGGSRQTPCGGFPSADNGEMEESGDKVNNEEAFFNDATTVHFARCWGVEIGKLEGRKAFFPISEARWNLMRNLPSDELAALMHKWAVEYNAQLDIETLDDFFSMKLAELFKQEGL